MRQIGNTYTLNILRSLMILLSLMVVSSSAFSQKGDGPSKKHKKQREEMRAQKIAFISNRLSISSEEAKDFWPLYNEYERESMKIHQTKRKLLKLLRSVDEMSDDEAYTKMEELLGLETAHGELRVAYLAKFAKVLDKKRAAKVYIIEEKWKRMLLKKLDKKGAHGHHPPPPRD